MCAILKGLSGKAAIQRGARRIVLLYVLHLHGRGVKILALLPGGTVLLSFARMHPAMCNNHADCSRLEWVRRIGVSATGLTWAAPEIERGRIRELMQARYRGLGSMVE